MVLKQAMTMAALPVCWLFYGHIYPLNMGYNFLKSPVSDGDSMQGGWHPLIPRDYDAYELKVGFYDTNLVLILKELGHMFYRKLSGKTVISHCQFATSQ
jgi:hypothetical protein